MNWFELNRKYQLDLLRDAYIKEPPELLINHEFEVYSVGALGPGKEEIYQEKMSDRLKHMMEDPDVIPPHAALEVVREGHSLRNLTLQQWDGDELMKTEPIQENTIKLPGEQGVYVFDVLIEDEEGFESYAFVVEVHGGMEK
ncbi:hypothetical protein LCL89_10210 [Halobacillus yeomjeoni]|uniref:hypothetical protein n=1 Tax=Halobacillus yeomjeoni TaxID=311194 RepID=UPI001CD4E22A|nr:hypothetical protein [Halobacillus yeomjeoni]MCA0984419.1 hypothetical protein [Halobacillus yeomjeoni]